MSMRHDPFELQSSQHIPFIDVYHPDRAKLHQSAPEWIKPIGIESEDSKGQAAVDGFLSFTLVHISATAFTGSPRRSGGHLTIIPRCIRLLGIPIVLKVETSSLVGMVVSLWDVVTMSVHAQSLLVAQPKI